MILVDKCHLLQFFIGKPEKGHHPLHFQADWLSKSRGGMIPGEVMEAVTQLQELAEKKWGIT